MNKKKKIISNNGGPYRVDKGIQMERKKHNFARFPFNKMKVGDSFLVPKKDQEPISVQLSIYSAVNSYNKHHGTKLRMATRKQDGGVRVWRIADKK